MLYVLVKIGCTIGSRGERAIKWVFREFEPFPFADFDKSVSTVEKILKPFLFEGVINKTNEGEQALLYELALGFHGIPLKGKVLELGTDYGATTAVMASGLRCGNSVDYPVFTVDVYDYHSVVPIGKSDDYVKRKNDRFRVKQKCWYELNLRSYICQIVCDDNIFLPFWNMPIRLAFIDALHDYESVARHIDIVSKYIVNRGWIVFHDYAEPGHADVVKAVNEFIDLSPNALRVFQVSRTVALQVIGHLNPKDKGFS